MLFWQHQHHSIPISDPIDDIQYDEKEFPPEPQPRFDFPTSIEEVKEEALVREYCTACITPEGEIKCPRRHRCKVCHCYMTDDEYFLTHKK